jgi:hypothetical protein
MTNDINRHRPSAEFRSSLELEITEALKAQAQRTTNLRNTGQRRTMFIGSLAATLAIGFVLGMAPAQIQDAQQRSTLVMAAESNLDLALKTLELYEKNEQLARRRVESGMTTRADLLSVEYLVREARLRVAAAQLNLDEIRKSSTSPRDELYAPLVDGRDFVKERLELQLPAAQDKLAHAEEQLRVATLRQRIAIATQVAVAEAETEVVRARSKLEVLVGKLALRKTFFESRLTSNEVERRQRKLELEQDLVITQRLLEVARARFELTQKRQQAAAVTRQELLAAELEVLQLENDLQQINFQLTIVNSGRGRGGD